MEIISDYIPRYKIIIPQDADSHNIIHILEDAMDIQYLA